MSTAGVAATAVVQSQSQTQPQSQPKRQCSDRSEMDPRLPCSRRVTWRIEKVGDKCNLHFERYFDTHWKKIPLDSIQRLSDDEKDFSDYKSSGLGGRPRKHPLPTSEPTPVAAVTE